MIQQNADRHGKSWETFKLIEGLKDPWEKKYKKLRRGNNSQRPKPRKHRR